MPRKHLIASGINKKQQQQAKIWMKCAKEIKAAAKIGGPNPEANPRLKAAIVRALQNNLSRESIEKNINGANKDSSTLKELYYEGYGPNGMGIIIKALTDNEQRTISAIRGYFSKLHGNIAKSNSVMILFDELSEFVIDKIYSEEKILEAVLECDIVDLVDDDDCYVLTAKPNEFVKINECLEKNNISTLSAEVRYIPQSTVSINDEHKPLYERFINQCEDDDDIQWVVTNCNNA